MATYQLHAFAGFSFGKCEKCKDKKKKLRQFKGNQMCNDCWIPVWLKTLDHPNNQKEQQQRQITKNLKICGYKRVIKRRK